MVRTRNFCPHVHLSVLTSFVRFILGTLIVLFFKCMAALFNPTHRRGESIKWGFVSYTVVMFSLATVVTAMNLHILSISFIDNRNFPGVEGGLPAGPLGYVLSIYNKPLNVIPNVAYYLSNWLADCMLVGFPFEAVFIRPMPDAGSSRSIVAT